ncbi:hypothetical protein BGZ68_010634 [Mortierella alpina]|nr:hypothetical protein BGZ68_010634 [Mortierella alpina]
MMPKSVTNSKRRELARRLQKKPLKLDKLFDCIICCQSKTVRCKLKLEERVGSLECDKCKATFSTSIRHLSHDVDVYHAWVDASEEQPTYPPSSVASQQPQVQKPQNTPRHQKRQLQQNTRQVEYSPQYEQQDGSYSPQYQQWREEEEQEADPQYGVRQVDHENHGPQIGNLGLVTMSQKIPSSWLSMEYPHEVGLSQISMAPGPAVTYALLLKASAGVDLFLWGLEPSEKDTPQ